MKRKKLTYYGKKCLIFLISVFILSVAVFYVARLAPGDPLISYYGDRTEKMSPEEREWAMEKLGLNEPISVQYAKWVKNAFHGEFGISFKYKQNVTEVISGRIGNTLLLGGLGFLFIFVGSLLLGILCAWYCSVIYTGRWLLNRKSSCFSVSFRCNLVRSVISLRKDLPI